MKKLLIIAVIAFFSLNSFTQEVKWYTIEEAVELNKTNPKKFFIDVYTDWCSWCKVMDKETFSHPEIAKILNENYYPIKFNAESTEPVEFHGKTFINEGTGRRATHQLAAYLLQGRLAYPSVAYLDENTQLLTSVAGFLKPYDIEPILQFFATNSYGDTKWEDFKAGFEGKVKAEETKE